LVAVVLSTLKIKDQLLTVAISLIFVQLVTLIDKVASKMPSAVVTNNISDQIPLKSLPPDGFVVVRRMSYGEELSRSAKATKLLVGGDGKGSKDNFQGEVDIQTEAIALWDFANLVVDHNCEDVDSRKLNFKNVSDVKKLDARVGKEIGQIIDDFNNVEESDDVKNS
jgi:hypothetical protein